MSAAADDPVHARVEALYREYAPELVGTVAGQLGWPRARVEDGCQRAWVILLRRPDVLDGPSPRGWLVTVARHACVRELRDAPPLLAADPPERPAPPLDTLLDARQALRQVAALRPVRRRVFERHLAGLSYREIEAELGVTYTNVNRQVTESRAELRAAA